MNKTNQETRNSRLSFTDPKLNKELNQVMVMVSHEEWEQKYFARFIVKQDGKIINAGD